MGKENPPLSSERVNDWFTAMPRHAQMFRSRLLHWLANADHVTGRAASGDAIYEEQAVFVLRLAGMLIDLRARFSGPSDFSPEEIKQGGFAAEHRERCRTKLVNALAALHSLLSDDELLWLELRRHEQGHPFLDGYRPKASDGARWNQWESKILNGRVLPIDEVIDRCARLESEHGDFQGVVIAIARRVYQHVTAVHLATIPLMAGLRL